MLGGSGPGLRPSAALIFASVGASVLAPLLAACAVTAPGPGSNAGADKGVRPRVVTTFLPITLFSKAVAGDCALVEPLLPASVGPHDFQARPADLVRLQQARVLVKNGLGLETFLDKLIATVDNPQLLVIDTSKAVTTLMNPDNKNPDNKNPDNKNPDHKNPDHKNLANKNQNPHIWLDPLRAAQQVEAIRDGLIAVDPGCKAGYSRNAAALVSQLQSLNRELASQLAPYAGKSFVAFHDFAPYFAERYRLKANFLVDLPEANPSPADLQRVTKLVKASELKALLSEPQEGSGSFNALVKDLGISVGIFDPIETGPAAALKPTTAANSANYYLETMRSNGKNLISAFGG
ncbi:MAG: metal ABC transporter solute-binding protein, Zn/Mn family [Synechococcus lacustris]